METVRTVVESLIRLIKAEIDPGEVLAAADDVFEVPNVPRLILHGPALAENGDRRTTASPAFACSPMMVRVGLNTLGHDVRSGWCMLRRAQVYQKLYSEKPASRNCPVGKR